MRNIMRITLAMACAGLLVTACGDTGGNGTGGGTGTGGGSGGGGGGSSGFTQPAGTVAVNFTIDDTANQVFTAGTLDWKGSFKIDATTRKITKDGTWGGPFPTLYDDGPWNAGGHEPAGSTAGDHRWGVTVFATPPATGTDTYEYGAQDHTNSGWLWRGSNGTFAVPAGATSPITATGLTLLAFGKTNLKLVIDTSQLLADGGTSTLADGGVVVNPPLTWDTSKVEVKGSAWGWSNVTMASSGGTSYTFVLKDVVGAGTALPHAGLLSSGDKPEFVFVFKGVEYKSGDGKTCPTQGVKAYLSLADGGFDPTPTPVGNASNGNTIVTVP